MSRTTDHARRLERHEAKYVIPRRLVPAIREVLTQSIQDGGSTLRDYAAPDGELGYFATRFDVYGREGQPCRHGDGGVLRRIAQGGRSTWYCPRCQR